MKNIKTITYTALFTALLIVAQVFSASLGQMVTGSIVNFLLISVCLLIGWKSALFIAICSPFFAFVLGIGPAMIQIVLIVALGNSVFVCAMYLLNRLFKNLNQIFSGIISVVISAVLKYLVLSLGVVKIAVPLLAIPEKAAKALFTAFGVTQLFTALVGGLIAISTVPLIKKAIKK